MLTTLLAWFYISFLCYGWGLFFIRILAKLYGSRQAAVYGFSITAFIGLSTIAAIAQMISVFTGLDNLFIQFFLFLFAVCSLYLIPGKTAIVNNFRLFITRLHPAAALLLAAMLLMLLVMSSYAIIHPDTIDYHEQSIKWAERYRVIPGLVHVNYLYGLQNTWFLLCGLFSFSFTGINALTFINTTALVWLLIFLIQKISSALKKPAGSYAAFPWLLLLFINLWAYTQIRLTATSASPDFIGSLYILLIAWLYIAHGPSLKETGWLIIYLCCFTITIKLSAVPILLLIFFILYDAERKKILAPLLLSAIVVGPFLLRNAVVSGHLLFPVSFPDVINTDWKYDTGKLRYINDYILAYARTHDTKTDVAIILNMPFNQWLQVWWQNLSLADKLIVAAQFAGLTGLIFNFKNIVEGSRLRQNLLFISLVGIAFWALKAPDPRFGTGFLLLFPTLVFLGYRSRLQTSGIFRSGRLVISLCMLMCITVSVYTTYRFRNYFAADAFISPEGITMPRKSVYYNEVKTFIPLININSKNVEMVTDSAQRGYFDFRGRTVEQGFKAKK